MIACLIGPSESKFSSKQDFTKAFIEVNLKLAPLGLNKPELQSSLRQCLDQLIQTTNYPKQLFTFQCTLVHDFTNGANVFPALLNACIALCNQAGIC